MPKLFIFAIGGTGERVLRSFTMVLASGAPTFDNYEVFPVIIDYDTDNADKARTVELLQNYADIHDAAFTRHSKSSNLKGQVGQFFAAKLRNLDGLDNYVFPFHPATSNEKFREHIGYDSLAGDTLGTAELLTSLFDKSQRSDTELNLDMTVGFKGNPNIGSVVFHTINNTVEFAAFRSMFQPGSGDKVVIIGSLYGVTGASGIPEIIKSIDAMQNNARVATILVLPYFAPMENATGAIQASRFNSKTKAALSFYKDSGLIEKIDKVYYVGDPCSTVVPYSEGGKDQINNANIVELIASLMIEHYVDGRGGKQKEFKFAMNANIAEHKGQKSGQRLFISDFDDLSNKKVLNHLVELAIALKCYHDEIHSKKAAQKDFYKYLDMDTAIAKEDSIDTSDNNKLRKLCSAFEKFYSKYQAWLKELDFEGKGDAVPANSHRVGLCDMTHAYSGIMLKEAVKADNAESASLFKRAKGYFSGGNSKSDLSDDYLLTRMNWHIRDDANGNGHYDTSTNSLRTGHEPEWVFADILHLASVDGFNILTTN
jgi:hypothetical protein